MGWSLSIGRISGTDIRLHVTFLLFLAWIGFADYMAGGPAAAIDSLVFIVLVFLCVTLHEFGHIAMARRFGIRTPQVVLTPIGGIANLERMPDKPREELLVAIAGPLVNVVIALLLMAVFGLPLQGLMTLDLGQASLAERLLLVNVMLVAFNLIPAFPMDGGRVLRALLAMKLGASRATALAARIGQGFAALFVLLGLISNPFLVLIGVFIYLAAGTEARTAAFTGFAAGLTVKDAMEPPGTVLQDSQPLSVAIEALLASPQKEFPVIGADGRVKGLLDRDAMIVALRDTGDRGPIGAAMRVSKPLFAGQPLAEAFTSLRGRGVSADIVVDATGHVAGVLSSENMAEMMLINSIRPGWRFRRS
jgi:Zn-dependent protease